MYIKNRIQDSGFRMRESGSSLIELIMFVVIVSTALGGVLLMMNQASKGSADPLIRKQAMTVAYSLLEEIESQDFIAAIGATGTNVTQENRASRYHIVSDYNGFATTGIFAFSDATSVSAVLPGYNASVSVLPVAWNGIASAVQINVTVTAPGGGAITATGYRTAH
ncbi:MAG: hypothetical protein WC216_09085 [Gallionella sp.]|jgi:MSHA pilin protein MshD